MKSRSLILSSTVALLSLCLQACAPLLRPSPPTLIPSELTASCLEHIQRPLVSWGVLAKDHSEVLQELRDCAKRHAELAAAVKRGSQAGPEANKMGRP